MRWFKDPPCLPMQITLHDAESGRLELDESGFDRLWNAGLFTGVGALVTGFGLKIARWTPGPMKLAPLAVATAGGASTALGVMSGLAHHNISFERGQGVRLRWRFGRARPRELRIAADRIAAFEVVHRSRRGGARDLERAESYYRLLLVTVDGAAIPLEEFGTRTQAELRQALIEQVLGRGAPVARPGVEPTAGSAAKRSRTASGARRSGRSPKKPAGKDRRS
ncbi:MAG: hypothetical protein JXR83_21240 [Deltaproteobacteria bacterium]|nr:hypothetical protein [Deltaproteobacteria bacterium]